MGSSLGPGRDPTIDNTVTSNREFLFSVLCGVFVSNCGPFRVS